MKKVVYVVLLLSSITACRELTYQEKIKKYETVGGFVGGYAQVEKKGLVGFINKKGDEIIACKYEEASDFKDKYASVKSDGLWGVIDDKNRKITPFKYTKIQFIDEGEGAFVTSHMGIGLINREGKEIIPCIYNQVEVASGHSLIKVQARGGGGGNCGLYDYEGSQILPCEFDKIKFLEETDYIIIAKSIGSFKYEYGLLDMSGKILIELQYRELEYYSRGDLFKARSKNDYNAMGIIDANNNVILPLEYLEIRAPSEGFIAIKGEGSHNWGFFDLHKGKVIVPCKYRRVSDFNYGIAVVTTYDLACGIIDKNGNVVLEPKYAHIGEFSNGMAPVEEKTHYFITIKTPPNAGFINEEGKLVIPIMYRKAKPFSEGYAAVEGVTKIIGQGEIKWGYINKSNEKICDFEYDEAYEFRDGMAKVYMKNKGYGYINIEGKLVIPCIYTEAEDFSDGIAMVRKYDEMLEINKNGKPLQKRENDEN